VRISFLAGSAVLVDTNVIADVIYKDPVWAPWAADQLNAYAGASRINPIIYSELCYHATDVDEVDQLVRSFGFQFDELPKEALFLASKAYRTYRQRGGTKTAPLPDFFIGAHAQALGIPILTRDAGRYRSYFAGVELICP
jgi:predicted nucleic acid-binding protein